MITTTPEHTIGKQYMILTTTVSFVLGLLIFGAIYMFSKDNLPLGIACLILPIPAFFLYSVFKSPRVGFISALVMNYFALGLARYIPAPMGLTIDGMLVLTWLSLVFSQFNHKVEWKRAAKDYTYLALIWSIMIILQLLNPEVVSYQAWIFGFRGYMVYILLTIPLVFIMFNKPRDLEIFITLFAWCTIIGVLKGYGQKYIALDRWEQHWLNIPGNRSTHILFGKLRVFSIFSDAGTYGSSMGYAGIFFTIKSIYEKQNIRKKLFYLAIGLGALYALLISGTRSAIAVPLVGFSIYTILSKQIKILVIIGTVVFMFFFILKYTLIGQGNYDIRRMRSGFSENNASMDVRMDNRRAFAEYLKTRPFGGGIASAGNNGLRFSPDTFLAQTATDGYYIQVWAETGIVGISFYLFMIFYIAIKSSIIIFFRLKKPENIGVAIGFTCGMYGLMVSAWTASSLGQMPNIIIVFASMTFVSLMPQWEKEENEKALKENTSQIKS